MRFSAPGSQLLFDTHPRCALFSMATVQLKWGRPPFVSLVVTTPGVQRRLQAPVSDSRPASAHISFAECAEWVCLKVGKPVNGWIRFGSPWKQSQEGYRPSTKRHPNLIQGPVFIIDPHFGPSHVGINRPSVAAGLLKRHKLAIQIIAFSTGPKEDCHG